MKSLSAFIFLIPLSMFLTSCKSDSAGILGQRTEQSSTEDPDIKNAPFAYDVAMDTITYNSCINNVAATSPSSTSGNIHGLKIGASEGFVDNLGTGAVKGGLKLRSEFLQYVGQKFGPDYPSDVINGKKISKILATDYSIFNSQAYLQIAIRRKTDLTAIPDQISVSASSIVQSPSDVVTFSQKLYANYLGNILTKNVKYNSAGTVLAEGSRIYNLSEAQDAIPIEGQFALNAISDSSYSQQSSIPTEPFYVAEAYAQRVRDNFTAGIQLLTVAFGGLNSVGSATPDESILTVNAIKRPYKSGTKTLDPQRAYGKGYYLKFDSKATLPTWPKQILTSVNEINLETGDNVGGTTWSCEFHPIAPKNYWNNNRASNPNWEKNSTLVEPNCAALVANDTICTGLDIPATCAIKQARAQQVKRIRRHYSSDRWNIGLLFPAKLKTGYLPPARTDLALCLVPQEGECYLKTTGLLSTTPTNPALALHDVGIQFDRKDENCYLTSNTTSTRDTDVRAGRCAQYASICVRNSSNY